MRALMRPALLLSFLAALSALPAGAAITGEAAPACTPEARQSAWNEGYVRGVEDIKAQLARATQQMQQQVQTQLNDQLAQLQRQRDADLGVQMRAAQDKALREAAAAPMPPALTGRPAAPGTTPAPPAANPEPALPAPAPPSPALPSDPAQLRPGSRLTITNAERLPPDLYAALIAYMSH